MIITWTIELLKGFGKLFLNPLFYWFIILGFIVSYRRIKRERLFFGVKIFNYYTEWRQTIKVSLLLGLLISILTLSIGIVLTEEIIIILTVVTIILSLTFNLTLLSANFTLGVTYIVMLFSPLIVNYLPVNISMFDHIYLTSIVILLGCFLIVESIFIRRVKRNELFPRLKLSERGVWVGEHRIKNLAMIPFFTLVPGGLIVPFADYWPYLTIGEQTYQLILIPFVLGFNFKNVSSLTHETIKIVARRIALLGIIIIMLAVGSLYVPVLSFIGVFCAIAGREFIFYRQRMNDKRGVPYYSPLSTGLRVLSVTPNGPADRLGVLVGETIVKVNNIPVSTVDEFYEALQNSGASFKLDVVDDANEVRFLMSAFYETEHHELGIVFPKDPYYIKIEQIIEKSV